MARYVKQAIAESEVQAALAQVRATVEEILAAVRAGGDGAVREISLRLDRWAPHSFRLSPSEISSICSSLPPGVIDDIRFAQEQVRRFAQVQRDALRDVEVETLPGVVL